MAEKIMLPISFELSYPPSVNTYWRRVGPRTIVSRKGRAYQEQVAALIKHSQLDLHLDCALSISVDIYPPDGRRRDIDNVTKALLDAMCKAGVYKDDSLIKRLQLEMYKPHRPDGLIHISIDLY